MSDSYIQLPVDGLGKKLDAAIIDVAGELVHRQRLVIADPIEPTELARIINGALAIAEQDIVVTGDIDVTGDTVAIDTRGKNSVLFRISTVSGTVVEGTLDDITWFQLAHQDIQAGSSNYGRMAATGNPATGGTYYVNCAGLLSVRLRAQNTQPNPVILRATPSLASAIVASTYQGVFNVQIGPGSNQVSIADAGNSQSIGNALAVRSANYLYAGSTFDSERNNSDLSILTSAARTASINGADQINYNGKSLLVILNVTIAGTGGLTLTIDGKAIIPLTYYALGAAFPQITATGLYVYLIGPDLPATVAGGYSAKLDAVVPRTWRPAIAAADATSWTYSLSACTLLN